MKMVNRLIDITEGDIRIDGGRSVRSLRRDRARRGIGYVIQQTGLFPHRTVPDNVGTVPRLLGWPKQRIRIAGARASSTWSLTCRGLSRPLCNTALGRRAAARRARPRARRRPDGDADGRALRGTRSDHPGAACSGVPADPRRRAQDGHLRHARHRRGDHDGRPDRAAPPRRPAGPVRHAGRDPRGAGRRVRRQLRRRRPRPEAPRVDPPGRARAGPLDGAVGPAVAGGRRCATRSR